MEPYNNSNLFYEEDSVSCKKVQAELLPAGWIWKDYSDGSGDLSSPDGKHYFSYDLNTGEYRVTNTGRWTFWKDYPERMYLSEFKKFAEEIILSGINKTYE